MSPGTEGEEEQIGGIERVELKNEGNLLRSETRQKGEKTSFQKLIAIMGTGGQVNKKKAGFWGLVFCLTSC